MRDLWALRWHCTRSRHATLSNTATCSTLENHFHWTQSDAVCIKKCHLNLCYAGWKLYILWCQRVLSGPELISDGLEESGNASCGQMNPCFSLFLGENGIKFSVPKTKRNNQTFTSDRCKSRHLSWFWGASLQTVWLTSIIVKVPLTWRHFVQKLFPGKQDNARPYSAHATTTWVFLSRHYTTEGMCLPVYCSPHLSLMENVPWKGESGNDDHRLLSGCLVSDKIVQIPLAKFQQLVSSQMIEKRCDTVVNMSLSQPFGVCCSHQNQNVFTKYNYVGQWKRWKTFLCTFVS